MRRVTTPRDQADERLFNYWERRWTNLQTHRYFRMSGGLKPNTLWTLLNLRPLDTITAAMVILLSIGSTTASANYFFQAARTTTWASEMVPQRGRQLPYRMAGFRVHAHIWWNGFECGLSQHDAQNERVAPPSHLGYIGHNNVVADLVISSQDMFETVVHRRMAERFAPNDRKTRFISLSPNVGMNHFGFMPTFGETDSSVDWANMTLRMSGWHPRRT